MAEEKKQETNEGKKEEKLAEQPKQTKEEKAEEKKLEEKKMEKVQTKAEKAKKTEAVVFGKDLGISTKHSIAICNFIRGKKIEEAIFLLEEVLKMKKAIPMKGEIAHRKGKIMSGRFPLNAAKQFIKLLKQLAANATVNGLDVEKGKIECKADLASRPYKRFGRGRFKRTHVTLKLKVKENKVKQENKNKEKEKKTKELG